MQTVIKSASKEVHIGTGHPFVVIGEKINPTGSVKLRKALAEEDVDFIQELASSQIDWGADIIDVNVGMAGIDEPSLMKKVVQAIISKMDVPLCIDSGDRNVLEAGLNAAPGKPIVNSVSAESKRLDSILPIVKDRAAAVIGLTMDDNGIPKTPEDRLAAADRIITRAVKTGIPVEDVIIDPLVLTVGNDSKSALITLKAIQLIHDQFDININLGASNVSFGLPDRLTINSAFLVMGIQAGATCSITDPRKLGCFVRAADLLLGRDDHSIRYLRYFRKIEKLPGLDYVI